MIKENVTALRKTLTQKGKQKKEEITLIAVSKTVDAEKVLEAMAAGQRIFGENRVQELLKKQENLSAYPDISWHLIGHLQTNKVKQVIGKVDLIHSLDRLSLADEIEKQAIKHHISVPCLIQVNMGEEESKFGIAKEEIFEMVSALSKYPHIAVKGLMTVAPYASNPEEIRWVFREMKGLFEKLKMNPYQNISMEFLSMGMSNDYEIAIQEGANMVRIGTGIFGERNYHQ